MRVPQDLAVVWIDGLDMSAHVSPSLTTVNVPTGQIGQLAATTLMALVRSQAIQQETLLQVELVIRRSSGALIHQAQSRPGSILSCGL